MDQILTPSKFLFDTDFGEPEAPPVEVPVEPDVPMMPVADHEAQLEEARQAAFEKGRAEGFDTAMETQEKRLADEAARLTDEVARILSALDDDRDQMEQESASLAFLVARRLSAHLVARQPLAEIVALIADCLGPLRHAPHLVIRINERDVDALKAKTDPIVFEKGFEGRLVILGEPDIKRGDCRIEWADGGIRKDRKQIEQDIDKTIRGYFQAKAATTSGSKDKSRPASKDDQS